MKKISLTGFVLRFLSVLLIAAMGFCMAGCDKDDDTVKTPDAVVGSGDLSSSDEMEADFYFEVTDADGKVTKFDIITDKTTVGEALLEQGLIDGENGAYGLYVKTVNGITADYDTDGSYWAFYINGEYASTGVDVTEIVKGSTYAFKVEK